MLCDCVLYSYNSVADLQLYMLTVTRTNLDVMETYVFTRLLITAFLVLIINIGLISCLECLVCYYSEDGNTGTTAGRDACIKPLEVDWESGVNIAVCPISLSVCTSVIHLRNGQMSVVRSCALSSTCEASSVVVDATSTNITQCCSEDVCNTRPVDRMDVDMHPANHIAQHACSSDSRPVDLYNNGTIYSPVSRGDESRIGPSRGGPSGVTLPSDYWEHGGVGYNPQGFYPNNANCAWRLSVEAGQRVLINFPVFVLEPCPYDLVTVHDGPDDTAPVIHQFCGTPYIADGAVISSSHQVYVTFTTDSSWSEVGFAAEFRGVPYDYREPSGEDVACSGTPLTMTTPTGRLRSPTAQSASENTTPLAEGRCAYFRCMNGGTCLVEDDTGAVLCSCHPGFTGIYCETEEIVTSCVPYPCQNHGICSDNNGYIYCQCATGYTGNYCQIQDSGICQQPLEFGHCDDEMERWYYNSISHSCDLFYYTGCGGNDNRFYTQMECTMQCVLTAVDPCASSPCLHGGSCYAGSRPESDGSRYRCACITGYEGQRCHLLTHHSDCSGSPCMHGGTCNVRWGEAFCTCPIAYQGIYCEQYVGDPCDSNPCLNSGTCTPQSGYFDCECVDGITGRMCQYRDMGDDSHGCESMICQNGGTCHYWEQEQDYICQCPELYSGRYCEILFPDAGVCESDPCMNGGTCGAFGGDYYCVCPENYSGHKCQYNDAAGSGCASIVCLHGGRCEELSHDHVTCHCPPPYSGHYCEIVLDSSGSWTTPGYDDGEWWNTPGIHGNQGHYPNNADCSWSIQAPSNRVVLLTFDMMRLEDSAGCVYDRLEVTDQHSNLLAGPFCGIRLEPLFINTYHHNITVRFTSDGSVTDTGFTASYRTERADQGVFTTPDYADMGACSPQQPTLLGGHYGNIFSPNYDQQSYPNNARCSWLITVDPGLVIELNVLRLQVEGCPFDFLTLSETDPDTGEVVNRTICDVRLMAGTRLLYTRYNQLRISFQSDESDTEEGFHLSYNAIHPENVPTSLTPTEIPCYTCEYTSSHGWSYGTASCIDPAQSADVPFVLCHGTCAYILSSEEEVMSVSRICIDQQRCDVIAAGVDIPENYTVACCNDRPKCNDRPLIDLSDQVTLPPIPANASRCYECTYTSAGKVILGADCYQPHLNNVADTASCMGKCFVKRRENTADSRVVTIIRGCEKETDPCVAAMWERDDGSYREDCCTGDLCNTAMLESTPTDKPPAVSGATHCSTPALISILMYTAILLVSTL